MKINRLVKIVVLLSGTCVAVSGAFAAESSYVLEKGKSSVSFLATGKPGFLKIRGEGAGLEGTLAVDGSKVSGEVTADLVPLKTGISLRDEHMHEKYLETGKFPTATLKIDEVNISGTGGDCSFAGKLTIKGTERPVSGSCKAEGLGSDNLKVSATSEIRMEDYPIGVPSHLGITVAEKVLITAELVAEKKSALHN